jgi:hypothetical protein
MNKIKILIIPFVWFVGIILLFWGGAQIHGYRLHVMQIPLPHPYPWKTVLILIAIMTIEAAVLLAIIRPWSYDKSWIRSVVSFFVFLSFSFIFLFTLMHAPAHVLYHFLWLVVISIALLVCSIWSGISALRNRIYNKRMELTGSNSC